MRNALRDAKIGYTGLSNQGNAVAFTIRDPAQHRRLRARSSRKLDNDLAVEIAADGAGTIRFRQAAIDARRRQAVEQSIEIIRRRIDETGTKEPTIQRQGEDRILVQLPGVDNPEHVKALLGRTAKLTFQLVDTNVNLEEARRGRLPPGDEILPAQDERGAPGRRSMSCASASWSAATCWSMRRRRSRTMRPVVSFKFDTVGARRFGDATRENVGKPFAIVLDSKVISAPVIREPILGGSGIISGSFTVQSASDLALLLRAGALPAPITILEERTVGAQLGADSIQAGTTASIVAVVLVVVFMVLFYGLFGVFANVALFFNLVLMLAALSLLGATLTLPGIAGIALTLGMAVDANVLIYERIKEELRSGRTMLSSLEAGFTPRLWHDPGRPHHHADRRHPALLAGFGAGEGVRGDAQHRGA